MNARRYRMNAAECLSAAEECELPYCGLTLAIAESWLLARQQQAMDELLVIWSKANSQTSTVSNRQSFILSTFTGPIRRFCSRSGTWRFNAPEMARRPVMPSKMRATAHPPGPK
jgi:hypothetical protein